MSESAVISGSGSTSVSWDLGVGLLYIAADDVPPDGTSAGDVQLSFSSRVWISLDRSGRPVDVDLLDVPSLLVGVVPPARRGGPGPDRTAPVPRGAIPWLLDTDSNWVWIELIRTPAERRLKRAGRVDVRLVGDRPTRLRLRIPVAGAPAPTGRAGL